MDYDLLNLPEHIEQNRHKLRRTVPAPNSYFLKVKCPGCNSVSMVFSNAQSAVSCNDCQKPLYKTTGGKIKIADKSEVLVLGAPKKN